MPAEASTVGVDQSMEELRRELAEAREQQAATAGFGVDLELADGCEPSIRGDRGERSRLCDAYDATIFRWTATFSASSPTWADPLPGYSCP